MTIVKMPRGADTRRQPPPSVPVLGQTHSHRRCMKKIFLPAFAFLLLCGAETARAQDTASAPLPTPAVTAEPAGPFRTDTAAQPGVPCVRQVRRIPPPPSPRSFRRQWPLAAVGSIAGWFVGDRIV